MNAIRKIRRNALKHTALTKKRNDAQFILSNIGTMSKIILPTNKENLASTKRNYIQKSAKHHENMVKRLNDLKGNGIKFNRNINHLSLSHTAGQQKLHDEFLRELKEQRKKDESRSPHSKRPMPRPFSRNRSHTSTTLKASRPAPRPMPRPFTRNRRQSMQSKDKEVKNSMNHLNQMLKNEKAPEAVKNVKEVKKSMDHLNQMLKDEKKVNPMLLKECEDSYAKLKLEMNEMEFSLHHNKREHDQTINILYSLLEENNFDYVSLDHRFKDEDQTKYGDYKKSYEEIDKKYKMLVDFYKELKGKCVPKDTEEDCYMMHKILRTEFNIMNIARDYYYEQRDEKNKLVHSIMDRELDKETLSVAVKRHFKDDEQATSAYYRKSNDEVNKTYKRVLDAYNELITKCMNNPRLTEMIHLQMTKLSSE